MSAERSPDVRRSPPKNIFGGRPADPRGTERSPRGFARIRGGSSSAEPVAPFWFWENITVFSCFFPLIACNSTCKGPKEQVHDGKCSLWSHLLTTYKATFGLK